MRRVVLDFDDVITRSSKRYCDIYNQLFKDHKDFVPADYTKMYKWDYKDICPLNDDLLKIYGMKEFFEDLEFIEDAEKYIKMLSDITDVMICTNGDYRNIIHKSPFIDKKMPYVDGTVFMTIGGKVHKGLFKMKNCVYVDDNGQNLESSDADAKICFSEKILECNEKWTGLRAHRWDKLYDMILSNL